jgi:tripartite-type tricarboxylate transporter receptor subunit TctC
VIVDNRPGAGGNIGATVAARAEADGHTLFWAQAATHGINPTLYRSLPYDPVKDFTPVAMIATEPLVLVARPDFAPDDLASLIAEASARPGRISFGSGGVGTTPHVAAELFAAKAGFSFTHVPYRGNALAVNDLMAGNVQLVFDGVNAALPRLRAGRLKALAVTSRTRSPLLPDVPALAEAVTGFEATSWGGVVAPAATPPAVIERLSFVLNEVLVQPAVARRFTDLGMTPQPGTPGEMDRFIRTEIARWRDVLTGTGIRID